MTSSPAREIMGTPEVVKPGQKVSLPPAASVFVYHNFSGETPVPGLTTVPEKLQPPVGPTFWASGS